MSKNEKIRQIVKSRKYNIQNGGLCFLPGDRTPKKTTGDGLLGHFQNKLKRYGWLYYFLLSLFGPVYTSTKFKKAEENCLEKFTEEHIIVNLGSGPQCFKNRRDIINVDLFAFNEVDIIADSECLPINDKSVDFVLNLALLEHAKKPHKIVNEMKRILKPGGEILAYVPFMVPFHQAPNDYYRWTQQGAEELFSCFDTVSVFMGCGPTSGMLYIFQEWLATLFSFGNRTLHDILFLLLLGSLFPLKYLDFFLDQISYGSNIASGFGIKAQCH